MYSPIRKPCAGGAYIIHLFSHWEPEQCIIYMLTPRTHPIGYCRSIFLSSLHMFLIFCINNYVLFSLHSQPEDEPKPVISIEIICL